MERGAGRETFRYQSKMCIEWQGSNHLGFLKGLIKFRPNALVNSAQRCIVLQNVANTFLRKDRALPRVAAHFFDVAPFTNASV